MLKSILLLLFIFSSIAANAVKIKGELSLENPFTTLDSPPISAIVELESIDNPEISFLWPSMGGSYTFDIPEGRYRLKISQHRYSPHIQEITVSEDMKQIPEVVLKLRALSGTIEEDLILDRDYIVLEGDEFVISKGHCIKMGDFQFLNAGTLIIEE